MIIRKLTEKEAHALLKDAGLKPVLPYRGYATTLSDDGRKRLFIGHHPDGEILLQSVPSKKEAGV
jgi:hypothetical protein